MVVAVVVVICVIVIICAHWLGCKKILCDIAVSPQGPCISV